MQKHTFITILFSTILFFSFTALASAHVVVKPNSVGVASYQTFTVSVPNEKDQQLIGLRLVIPNTIESISPNVKPGWTINVKKNDSSEDAKGTEISWSDGSVPSGQRDDFFFSAKVPASPTTITWKAYQTYQDGTVVSWDQNPDTMKNLSDDEKEALEKKGKGPYSQSDVVNDLQSTQAEKNSTPETVNNTALLFSVIAIVLSAVSLARQRPGK
jgi:uncharacterized protein YcnI